MDEFFPLISSAVLGWLLWRGTSGRLRAVLAAIGVFACAFAATIVSREYEESWAFIAFDLFEAVVGMAVGAGVSRWMVQRTRSSATTRAGG
jgi:hypothetical protein